MQVASSLEVLKVKDSPVKKLDFTAENKENMPATAEPTILPESEDLKKPIAEIIKTGPAPVKVAEGVKADEADEPILQENPNRFVLFPIKYHEVRACIVVASRRVTRTVAAQG